MELFNNIIIWIVLAVIVVLGVTAYFLWNRKSKNVTFPLQRRSRLLSPAEKRFFECLSSSLSEDFFIFTKVAMLDVVESSPSAGLLESRQIKNRLSTEFLDYVLCKKRDLSIFGIIELENFDKGRNEKEQADRESLITEVCKTAHLRLFYFDVRQDYQGVDILRLVTGKSSKKEKRSAAKNSTNIQFTIDNTSYAAYAKEQTCPKCNGEVVTKVAVRGKRIGEKFLMCRKYPYCDYRIAMTDKHILQKEQRTSSKKDNEANKPGFSGWSG